MRVLGGEGFTVDWLEDELAERFGSYCLDNRLERRVVAAWILNELVPWLQGSSSPDTSDD